MSLQQYYDVFRQCLWAHPDPARCRCHGGGWALSEVDTWHECPIHFTGQPHPEDYCDAPKDPIWLDPDPAPAPIISCEGDPDIPF